MKVYLDNGNSTKCDEQVVEIMKPFLEEHYGSPMAPHKQSKEIRDALKIAIEKISAGIHAKDNDHFYFSSSDDECNYRLFISIYLEKIITGQKNHIIISERESSTIQEAAMFFASQGCKLTVLPVDSNGLVQVESLKESINQKTALVSVSMVDRENGAIMPIEELAQICNEHQVPMHCDATHAIGKEGIDVQMLGIEYLTMTGRTMHGPSGIGALWIKDDAMLMGLDMPIKNAVDVIGLGKAIESSVDAIAFEMEDVRELRDELEEHIRQIDDSLILVPWVHRSADTLMVGFGDIHAELLAWHLNKNDIYVHIEHSPELVESMDIESRFKHTLVSFSLSRYTTQEEIAYVKEKLSSIVRDIRDSVSFTTAKDSK